MPLRLALDPIGGYNFVIRCLACCHPLRQSAREDRHQNFNPFTLRYELDFSADVMGKLDRRLGIAMAVLLCAIEGRQNQVIHGWSFVRVIKFRVSMT